ncbi:cytochrome C-type biogenesis protein [Escherichia coli]|uniref:Cytochrome C-type biogenesis protein n=1 Tax=Escherichia coli TaxID=562 RepID=A0A376S9Z4_ECOLX|nr:cytochrome C-type biogenesis protein [Escherichia coli]
MKSGDSVDIHEYRFTFRDVKEVTGPNWRGGVATIGVTRDGKPETVLYAEKRYYNTAGSMMTEAAIDGGITRDLYAALGEELENGAWAVRLYYKPFVRWIWAGGLMMALGGLLCLFDPRYRKRVSPQKTCAGGCMKRKVLLIPLIIFLAIAAALLWQLARNAEGDDPTNLESALIGKASAEVSPRITGTIRGSFIRRMF